VDRQPFFPHTTLTSPRFATQKKTATCAKLFLSLCKTTQCMNNGQACLWRKKKAGSQFHRKYFLALRSILI